MRTRSAAFDDAVINGGAVISRCHSLFKGTIRIPDLPIIEGSITVDATASARRTLRAVVVDADGTLTPSVATHPLSPFGNELDVRTGFRYPDGTEELLPTGIFRILEVTPSDDGHIEISGMDRSSIIAAARFEKPFTIAANTNTISAIIAIIESRFPGLSFEAVTSSRKTPLTVFEEGDKSGDPWQNAQQIASADGLEVFFDPEGKVIIRFEPDPLNTPVSWEHLGDENSIILSITNRQTSDQVYNVAVASGEGTENVLPVRATAEITDPTSPIFPGTFGRRPVFLVSPFIQTFAQAQDAANALLRRKAGGQEETTFTAMAHPAHEAGDVVRVVDTRLGIDAHVVLQSFTIDLAMQQPSNYTTKVRRVLF